MADDKAVGIQELHLDEMDQVNGGFLGLERLRIVIFGIEVSDGDPNT
ncbi:hypothetical protein [Sphingomonas aerolata]